MNSAEYHMKFLKNFNNLDNLMVAGSWSLIDQDGYELFLE